MVKGNRKISLSIIILISILTFVSATGKTGGFRFGIIRAIQNRVNELKGKVAPYSNLPDISTFMTQKSERFIVDIDDISDGHPFKGQTAHQPHQGAHVHFDNTTDTWPEGGVDRPENYPPIYAPANGVIDRVDYVYPLGTHDRYGVDLAFARDSSGDIYLLCYSIEPMIPEPSENFYRRYILVSKGQEVKKGDVIAYMYTPQGGGLAIHIHFHIVRKNSNNFMAPAIFTFSVVEEFKNKWGTFGTDNGDTIPACMGYRLSEEENPFGTGVKDKLW